MIKELFKVIDGKDPEGFVAFLSTDCVFRFGNLPLVVGVADIRKFVADFFASIDALSHDIKDGWSIAGGFVCHGFVSYTRKNGSVLTVPFANVFKLGRAGIIEYLIFADTSQLYQ